MVERWTVINPYSLNQIEVVSASDFDKALEIAKDWMREYGVRCNHSPDRIEADIVRMLGSVKSKEKSEAMSEAEVTIGPGAPPTERYQFPAKCCKCGKVDWKDAPVLGIYFCSYACANYEPEGRVMMDLFKELDEALEAHKSAERKEQAARGDLCDAVSRLNAAQKAIDKAMAATKAKAPWNTDWHSQLNPPQSVESR